MWSNKARIHEWWRLLEALSQKRCESVRFIFNAWFVFTLSVLSPFLSRRTDVPCARFLYFHHMHALKHTSRHDNSTYIPERPLKGVTWSLASPLTLLPIILCFSMLIFCRFRLCSLALFAPFFPVHIRHPVLSFRSLFLFVYVIFIAGMHWAAEAQI